MGFGNVQVVIVGPLVEIGDVCKGGCPSGYKWTSCCRIGDVCKGSCKYSCSKNGLGKSLGIGFGRIGMVVGIGLGIVGKHVIKVLVINGSQLNIIRDGNGLLLIKIQVINGSQLNIIRDGNGLLLIKIQVINGSQLNILIRRDMISGLGRHQING